MMAQPATIPPIVFTLWHITVVVGFVVLLPIAVYWLHTLWRTAASIRRYSTEAAVAARAIESNVGALAALNTTLAVGSDLLSAAQSVTSRLDALATALEARAGR